MKPIKLIIILAVLVLVTSLPLSGQSFLENEPQHPSSDVWDFVHYGEVSPNLYTGTLSASIPFYTYKDPDFTIPISFDYASNGCIPNVRAGILGPGWTLNAGGVISREIRGLPDNWNESSSFQGYYNWFVERPQWDTAYVTYRDASLHPDSRHSANIFSNTHLSNIFYDADPDIFHFNFPGYSGTFHLGFNGKIYVYNTSCNPNDLKIEIGIANNPSYTTGDHFTDITITTADGYRYIFDSENGHDGSNLDMGQVPKGLQPYESHDDIQAWHLSRIVAPNGRTAQFHYGRSGYLKTPRPLSIWSSGIIEGGGSSFIYGGGGVESTWYYSQNAHLTRIEINDVDIIFTYETGIREKYRNKVSYPSYLEIDDAGSSRLTGVRVTSGEETVANATLSYVQSNQNSQVRFLQDVKVDGIGTYGLQYADLYLWPAYLTYSLDHWGFYNGRNGQDNFKYVSVVSQGTEDETLLANSVRTPFAAYASSGLLTAISYPTGGRSEFVYEPNAYRRQVIRGSQMEFEPELIDGYTSTECGGLRIKQVKDYDADNEVLRTRTFHYTVPGDENKESGILVHLPRYWARFIVNTNKSGKPYQYFEAKYSNNLVNYSGTHIEYPTVKETNSDGSSILYTFSSCENYPDFCFRSVPYGYEGTVLNPASLTVQNNVIQSAVSLQALRGRLLSKTILNTSGVPVQRDSSLYSADSIYVSSSYATIPEHLYAAQAWNKLFVGRSDLSSSIQTRIVSSNQDVSTTTTYTYNATGQTASESVTGSDGTVRRTEYLYVTDSCRTGTVDAAMLAANCIGTPWRERVYEGNTLVSETVRVFYQPDSQNHPTLFCLESSSMRDGRTNVVYTTTFQHDALGRTVQVTGPDGRSSVHLWGHGGLYPVARIDGATLSQVRTAIGDATLGTAPLSGGMDATTAGLLRSSLAAPAEVTIYAWDPLVGLTATTGPDGRTTTYEYNLTGKLKGIRDDGGHLVEEYRYSPDNKLN